MINETVAHDDFFDSWKTAEERYVKERDWLLEVKKLYTPEVLNIKRQAIPEGSSKVAHYNNIVEEAYQRAQSIGATYLICASNWLPIFSLTAAFESIKDIGAVQGSYTAGIYKGLIIVISPAMDSFEMLCGADTPTPEYNTENIDAGKFILLKLED
jgi:hypothetical protein